MERKILMVDDEATMHVMVRTTLAPYAYRLLDASDGKTGLELARSEGPDLVLLDLHMPEMDGREVLKALRRQPDTQMLPVILLTAESKLSDKLVGFQLGADDYITKPFEGRELVSRIDRLLRRHERDLAANPLTRLPGNPTIEEEVNRRIREEMPFAFFYIDIDHFKAYNDVYGYAKGDHVIQETASILLEGASSLKVKDVFVGHIGGDDFVLMTPLTCAEKAAQGIIARFDARASSFYRARDRQRGYILAKDRRGQDSRFPLVTLSIAVAGIAKRSMYHYAEVSDAVVEIKHSLKSRDNRRGSAYLLDRRSHPGR
jgi:diguanylate cyclase (GGDEF)-like protein